MMMQLKRRITEQEESRQSDHCLNRLVITENKERHNHATQAPVSAISDRLESSSNVPVPNLSKAEKRPATKRMWYQKKRNNKRK